MNLNLLNDKPDTPQFAEKLEEILISVQKPGRYVGGELNQVVKDWSTTDLKVALLFPDIYDIGVSNLGLTILYELINQRSDSLAERAYSPWVDMEQAMREREIPLYSLENKRPLKDFDILGITLPYESLFTNVLNALDLADIPLRSKDRGDKDPIIIAGGHAAFNPEPLSDFIDAYVIGEGEEIIHDILNCLAACKKDEVTRQEKLLRFSSIPGIYIPAFYQPVYLQDGTLDHMVTLHGVSPIIKKRIVPKLPEPPTHIIVPSIDVVHNRVAVEIMRGCTRGCRFCHAGMVTRPVRERSVDDILTAIDHALKSTGFEDVSLLSLSSSDYTHINELVERLAERYHDRRLSISLPSLRIETLSVDLIKKISGSRSGGFTLAPEAATERMRNIINKPIPSQQLLSVVEEIYSRDFPTIKLYFMIGHPSETLEDIEEMIHLCKSAIKIGRRIMGNKASLNVSASTFIPKPHTPFQWVACETTEKIIEKQSMLRNALRVPGIKFNWTDPRETQLEAWLSRGDRKLGEVIYHAWRCGARFDAWQDQFNYYAWEQAFKITNIDPQFYLSRHRSLDEKFPWDHISTGVSKKHLAREYQLSLDGITRQDCRNTCYACGITTAFSDLRSKTPDVDWKCPDLPEEML